MAVKKPVEVTEAPVEEVAVDESLQAPASVVYIEGTPAAEYDPYQGQGGVYYINEEGKRVRAE